MKVESSLYCLLFAQIINHGWRWLCLVSCVVCPVHCAAVLLCCCSTVSTVCKLAQLAVTSYKLQRDRQHTADSRQQTAVEVVPPCSLLGARGMFRIPVFYWLVTRLNRSTAAAAHLESTVVWNLCQSQRSATAAALRLASSGPVALLLPCSVERAVCVDVLPFAAGASDVYSAQCSVFTIFHCSCSCSANADSQLIFCPLLLLFAVPFCCCFLLFLLSVCLYVSSLPLPYFFFPPCFFSPVLLFFLLFPSSSLLCFTLLHQSLLLSIRYPKQTKTFLSNLINNTWKSLKKNNYLLFYFLILYFNIWIHSL